MMPSLNPTLLLQLRQHCPAADDCHLQRLAKMAQAIARVGSDYCWHD